MSKTRGSEKQGSSRGSVVPTNERSVENVKLFVTDYTADTFNRRQLGSINELPEKGAGIQWLEVQGLHAVDLLKYIGEKFDIHELTLEDVVNPNQPPKIEAYDEHLFIIIKMLSYEDQSGTLLAEHISIMLMQDMIISFQETDEPYFAPIYKRLENPKGRMRKYGADYLLYALLDLVVDHYFLVIETLEDRFEIVESEVVNSPQSTVVKDIHQFKRQIISFRKFVRPLREVVNLLIDDEINLVSDKISIYLRDLYNHTIQVIDSLEMQYDLAAGLMDTYISQVSNHMNEVMKVLTMISTIFIPLGFLAGVYGMNFKYMPELDFRYGYFIVLGVMFIALIGMLFFFKRKKWL